MKPGKMDFSPNQLEHIYDYVAGGLGAFAMRTVTKTPGNVYKAMQGDWENVEMNDIIFVRKMVGSLGNAQDRRQYYENAEEVTIANKQLDFYRKAGDSRMIQEVLKDNRRLIQLGGMFKNIEKQLSDKRKRLKAVRDNTHIKEGARTKMEDRLKEEMDRLIDRANRLYNSRIRPQ